MDYPRIVWILLCVATFLGGVAGTIAMRYEILKRLGAEPDSPRINTYFAHVLEFLFSALIVFSLTIALGEFGVLRRYFYSELNRFHSDTFINPDYLRKTFKKEALQKFRIVTTKALYDVPLEEEPGSFLDLMKNTLFPMLDSVLRYNLKTIYDQHIEEKQGTKHLKVMQHMTCIYKHYSLSPKKIIQPFTATMEPINGVEPKDLFRVTEFIINEAPRHLPDTLPWTRLEDGRYKVHVPRYDRNKRYGICFYHIRETYTSG